MAGSWADQVIETGNAGGLDGNDESVHLDLDDGDDTLGFADLGLTDDSDVGVDEPLDIANPGLYDRGRNGRSFNAEVSQIRNAEESGDPDAAGLMYLLGTAIKAKQSASDVISGIKEGAPSYLAVAAMLSTVYQTATQNRNPTTERAIEQAVLFGKIASQMDDFSKYESVIKEVNELPDAGVLLATLMHYDQVKGAGVELIRRLLTNLDVGMKVYFMPSILQWFTPKQREEHAASLERVPHAFPCISSIEKGEAPAFEPEEFLNLMRTEYSVLAVDELAGQIASAQFGEKETPGRVPFLGKYKISVMVAYELAIPRGFICTSHNGNYQNCAGVIKCTSDIMSLRILVMAIYEACKDTCNRPVFIGFPPEVTMSVLTSYNYGQRFASALCGDCAVLPESGDASRSYCAVAHMHSQSVVAPLLDLLSVGLANLSDPEDTIDVRLKTISEIGGLTVAAVDGRLYHGGIPRSQAERTSKDMGRLVMVTEANAHAALGLNFFAPTTRTDVIVDKITDFKVSTAPMNFYKFILKFLQLSEYLDGAPCSMPVQGYRLANTLMRPLDHMMSTRPGPLVNASIFEGEPMRLKHFYDRNGRLDGKFSTIVRNLIGELGPRMRRVRKTDRQAGRIISTGGTKGNFLPAGLRRILALWRMIQAGLSISDLVSDACPEKDMLLLAGLLRAMSRALPMLPEHMIADLQGLGVDISNSQDPGIGYVVRNENEGLMPRDSQKFLFSVYSRSKAGQGGQPTSIMTDVSLGRSCINFEKMSLALPACGEILLWASMLIYQAMPEGNELDVVTVPSRDPLGAAFLPPAVVDYIRQCMDMPPPASGEPDQLVEVLDVMNTGGMTLSSNPTMDRHKIMIALEQKMKRGLRAKLEKADEKKSEASVAARLGMAPKDEVPGAGPSIPLPASQIGGLDDEDMDYDSDHEDNALKAFHIRREVGSAYISDDDSD